MILSVASRAVVSFVDIFFVLYFSLSSLDQISSSAYDSYVAFSSSCLLVLSEKIYSSTSDAVSPLASTISVRNGGRRTAFLDVQSQSFFNFAILPAAFRRKTSVVGRQIFSPSPEKARSISIEATVVASRDTVRAKVVTVFPRDLFPTDACSYVTCMPQVSRSW